MNTREKQKEQREEMILVTALDLFIKKGYAATKTSDLSKSLGMSEGLLFHYFKSKEVLLETLVDIAISTNEQWINLPDTDPIEYFTGIAQSVLTLVKEDATGAKFFILIAQLRQSESIPEHIKAKVMPNSNMQEVLVTMIKKGQNTGAIRTGDPLALAFLFSNTLNAIAVNHMIFHDILLPDVSWIMDILKNHKD